MVAKKDGHNVLFTPPHHSNLQPSELVWGVVKGAVGRQYTEDTTFQDVRVRLDAALDGPSWRTIEDCMNNANGHLAELYNYIMATEDMPNDDQSDDSAYGSDSEDSE
ncbi:hypothetical protein ACHHYP_11952 [Achlya hypogyna]|uniref:Tc1-like transposase DDE domain-containing protein n=1 Tax=Achlya hypogyna TaxID=1202772 RepID=A0A1V9YHX5_ACHHY|nr:hypothetical protein ACHHYP_11952 [Achlya hypogyna]